VHRPAREMNICVLIGLIISVRAGSTRQPLEVGGSQLSTLDELNIEQSASDFVMPEYSFCCRRRKQVMKLSDHPKVGQLAQSVADAHASVVPCEKTRRRNG
jgi:hypothetical protein